MKLGCRLLSILLRGTCLLVLAVASITARYLPAGPAPGLAQSQEVALLEFSTRLENFQVSLPTCLLSENAHFKEV